MEELSIPVESGDSGEQARAAAAFAAADEADPSELTSSEAHEPSPAFSASQPPSLTPAEAHDPSPARGGIDVGKLVAGGFTVVSTSIAIVGGITGAVSRFLRNNPIPLLAALILSVAAVGVSLAGSQLAMAMNARPGGGTPAGSRDFEPGILDAGQTDPPRLARANVAARTRKRAGGLWQLVKRLFRTVIHPTTISFILFSLAALITVFYLEKSLASSDRPRITSTWTEIGRQPILSVTVKISDMKVSDTLNVSVRAVTTSESGDELAGLVVYTSQTGSDSAGDGDLSFNVPLPSGYDGLRVVANLGSASVTCNGTQILTPANPSPSAIPTSSTPVPVTTMPDNTIAPIFSCVTAFAPNVAPAASPSP
ncbi:MAG: hypothetical protein ACTHJW_16425 [Streptosporangiaceae bacterium]